MLLTPSEKLTVAIHRLTGTSLRLVPGRDQSGPYAPAGAWLYMPVGARPRREPQRCACPFARYCIHLSICIVVSLPLQVGAMNRAPTLRQCVPQEAYPSMQVRFDRSHWLIEQVRYLTVAQFLEIVETDGCAVLIR